MKPKRGQRMWDGQKLKQFRVSLGKTQEEFAALMGLSVGPIRDWEQGRYEIPLDKQKHLTLLAEKFSEPSAVPA